MLRKGLRIGARHDTPARLRWLGSVDGQKYLLTLDGLPSGDTETIFSKATASYDPVACITRAYHEQLLTAALYSQLSCLKEFTVV